MANIQNLRPHLTKEQRLPKCFKEVEKVLQSVKSCQQNFKTVLANSRLRGYNHRKVYSMTVNILKNYSYIQKIINKLQLLEKEQYLRREIASVLIYELIFGKGYLPGESKVVKTIQSYESDIFQAHEVFQNKVESSLIVDINIPRYVRVHTLLTTVPYVIKDLISYGFHHVLYDDNLTEEKYLELVKTLNKGSFLIDFHFKDVLVFEHCENLVSLDLYKNGHIFLQDKSSYIPVHVLDPQPGCAVLDACAAPGMKTAHIASKMKNRGILIACERDKNRFECLKGMLDCGSVKICKTFCKDFKLIDPNDQAYSTIEYILLDPSCSGSGMVNRMDEVTDTENSKNAERLKKLAGFQIILLKHSLQFPAVKRVVYSTCSIHEEENEYVVHEALKVFSRKFKLVPAMPEWSNRGSENFEFGKLCLRTDPKVHLTNGFFVAVFERINYDEDAGEWQQNYQVKESSGFKKQKKKFLKTKESSENYVDMKNSKRSLNIPHASELHQENDSKHNASLEMESESYAQNAECKQEQTFISLEPKNKKHKRKKKENSNEFTYETNSLNLESQNESVLKCSKLKKHADMLFLANSASIHLKKEKSYNNERFREGNFGIAEAGQVKFEPEQNFICSPPKKHKKKRKDKTNEYLYETNSLNLKTQNESVFKCHKLKKHTDTSFLENAVNENIHSKNDKFDNDEQLGEQYLYHNFEVKEESQVTKLHKKKKKGKKEHIETDLLQSSVFSQKQQNMFSGDFKTELEDDNGVFITKNVSMSKKCMKNTGLRDSEELASTKSFHKKKKKKELLNIDDIQSCSKLKEEDNSHLQVESDKINGHMSIEDIFVKDETTEEVVDLILLHKKKKKKKNHKMLSVEKEDI